MNAAHRAHALMRAIAEAGNSRVEVVERLAAACGAVSKVDFTSAKHGDEAFELLLAMARGGTVRYDNLEACSKHAIAATTAVERALSSAA